MKKRVLASLSLLERDYRPSRGGNSEQLLDLSNSLVLMKEKLFREFGSALQPLQKIMSHNKSPKYGNSTY